MPIRWQFSRSCFILRQERYVGFSGSFGPQSLDWPDDTCSITSNGDAVTVSVGHRSTSSSSGYDHNLLISIDTAHHVVSKFVFRTSEYGDSAFVLLKRSTPYVISPGHRKALYEGGDFSFTWRSMCGISESPNGSGWVSFGDTAQSLDLSAVKQSPTQWFSVINPLEGIRFFALTHAEQNFIHILDILGRECDRIAIPAGAESVDYNTSRLAPGIYLALLGRDVVKFLVR
jgi:hypothetical protein